MKQNLLLLVLSTGLSLLMLEGILRWLEPPQPDNALAQGHFQQRSSELGWDGRPGAEGYYAAGRCYGHVTLDEHGNRRNSGEGTFRPDDETILFIGDSNTMALEVDDDQTVPAVLEQELRRQGLEVNVVNLGVRAYGTDQSVRKALLHAERLRPRQIIYMYSDNDFYDNNIVRLIPGTNGKGVYLRDAGGDFLPYNYPVPDYPRGLYAAVLLDREGRPEHFTGRLPAASTAPASRSAEPGRELWATLRLWGALAELKRSVLPSSDVEKKWRYWQRRRADPYAVMHDSRYDAYDVFITLFHGLIDGGSLRLHHREYYEAQFVHLLGLLRDIPSLERIHLVEFISEATLDLMQRGEPSTNRQLFENMLQRGFIDSYVNLNEVLRRDGIRARDQTCQGDNHFNAAADRWAAAAILERVRFGD